ncbi:MAG: hypothetical protein WCA89_04985 [Terracidiphilus sp.]
MTVREPVEYAFGVALAKASATSGEIRPCERGWRAGERANDRLTLAVYAPFVIGVIGAQASAPMID